MQQRGTTKRQQLDSLHYTIDQLVVLLFLFIVFSVLVANLKKLLQTVANLARRLLNRGGKEKEEKTDTEVYSTR